MIGCFRLAPWFMASFGLSLGTLQGAGCARPNAATTTLKAPPRAAHASAPIGSRVEDWVRGESARLTPRSAAQRSIGLFVVPIQRVVRPAPVVADDPCSTLAGDLGDGASSPVALPPKYDSLLFLVDHHLARFDLASRTRFTLGSNTSLPPLGALLGACCGDDRGATVLATNAHDEAELLELDIDDASVRAVRLIRQDPRFNDPDRFFAAFETPRCLAGGRDCLRIKFDQDYVALDLSPTHRAASTNLLDLTGMQPVDVAWADRNGTRAYVLAALGCPAPSV